MKNAIEMTQQGIKCDNKECDYNIEIVKCEDYKNWVNKPCPKYGENLLTEADYKSSEALMNIVNLLNDVLPSSDSNEEEVMMNIEFDGTGKMEIDIKE